MRKISYVKAQVDLSEIFAQKCVRNYKWTFDQDTNLQDWGQGQDINLQDQDQGSKNLPRGITSLKISSHKSTLTDCNHVLFGPSWDNGIIWLNALYQIKSWL